MCTRKRNGAILIPSRSGVKIAHGRYPRLRYTPSRKNTRCSSNHIYRVFSEKTRRSLIDAEASFYLTHCILTDVNNGVENKLVSPPNQP